ncbi:uncharacterized protein BYT42DRAFT_482876, partial [Radiomyces spectabilis]|uniref:uncharacterized protein n=1 Tax=Radiomyces spectabilis TaxID=64574 RepID=UPI00221FD212
LLKCVNDLKVSHSTVYNFMRSKCNVSLTTADFDYRKKQSAKIEERYGWVRKCLTNYVFLEEPAVNINIKTLQGLSQKGTCPIVTGPTTR